MWKYAWLFLYLILFIIGLVVLLGTVLYFREEGTLGEEIVPGVAIGLFLAIYFGGYLCYWGIGFAQGRAIAIISNEGIALRQLNFKVIPWESIDSFGETTRFQLTGQGSSTRQGLQIVGIRYASTETAHERTATINHHFTNYSLDEILEILWNFNKAHKSN